MPLARAWGAALTLRDGRVLVLGGTTKAGDTASAELYDPTTNRWSEAQPMLHAHGAGLTATLLRDGRVLVLGGGRTAGAELFDPGHTFTPATRRRR
jgi:N-acetylneuraminic acid mutarotase